MENASAQEVSNVQGGEMKQITSWYALMSAIVPLAVGWPALELLLVLAPTLQVAGA